MTRRTFGAAVAGVLGLVGLGRAVTAPGYSYDWPAGTTDDPQLARSGLLVGGPECHRIHLNGVDVTRLPVRRLRSGPDGFVTFQVRGVNGEFIEYPEGHVLEMTLRGGVRYTVVNRRLLT